jgi:hypothetical protein
MATVRRVKTAVQRQIASAVAVVLLASATVWASAEPEMTFNLSGVRSTVAAAAFEKEMQRARAKVREWWGATFEGFISVQTNTDRVVSMALIPAWRGERGQMIFGAKRVWTQQRAHHVVSMEKALDGVTSEFSPCSDCAGEEPGSWIST